MRFRLTLATVGLLFALGEAAIAAGHAASAAPQKVDLGECAMLDVHGARQTLAAAPQQAASVFVFLSSECPISREYVPELNRLAKAAEAKKIRFYGVLSDASRHAEPTP